MCYKKTSWHVKIYHDIRRLSKIEDRRIKFGGLRFDVSIVSMMRVGTVMVRSGPPRVRRGFAVMMRRGRSRVMVVMMAPAKHERRDRQRRDRQSPQDQRQNDFSLFHYCLLFICPKPDLETSFRGRIFSAAVNNTPTTS